MPVAVRAGGFDNSPASGTRVVSGAGSGHRVMPQGEPSRRELGLYLAMAQVGMEMVAPLGIGIAIDYYAGTSPWATVIGFVLGFVGGFFHLLSLLKQQEQEQQRPRPPGGPGA